MIMTNNHNIIEQSNFKIDGGILPKEFKSLSSKKKISELLPSDELVLPLSNNTEHPVSCKLKVGDEVSENQLLAESKTQQFSTNIHSGIGGVVSDIGLMELGHKSGQPLNAIKIFKADHGSENSVINAPTQLEKINWETATSAEIITRVHQAGIVGLGGAAFPTHIKLAGSEGNVDTLIVNAMECEPYITCDDRLLQEQSDKVLIGTLISARAVGATTILFGIEDNKPDAVKALAKSIEAYLDRSDEQRPDLDTLAIKIIVAKTKYPSGGEKQLIQLLTGKQVPQGKYPAALGILVQNVATLYAIQDAIINGQVMTRRLVTITGDLVNEPGNYWIKFGTPIRHIIKSLKIPESSLLQVIFGGPLMGEKISEFSAPTRKSTNCIIFNKSDSSALDIQPHKSCIRCGECEVVCPINLVPQQLYWFTKTQQWEQVEQQNISDCIECGACAYVCPSEIPLVGYYQYAKSEIRHNTIKQHKSELAKTRFENRQNRLARIKQEREEKRRKTAEARKLAAQNSESDPDGKKSAIEAALRRVQSKKDNQE